MSEHVDVYTVGLLLDWKRHQTKRGVRRLASLIWGRQWRTARNCLNGYLAEHDGHAHNAGRGWTKRAAVRRVDRICAASSPAVVPDDAAGARGSA